MTFLIAGLIGYASIVIADFLIHRNILHGKWKFVKRPEGFFRAWLYPHYVSHLKVHHSHSVTARAELSKGLPVPLSLKEKIEKQFEDLYWTHLGLLCSDHGMSIKDGACLTSYLSLLILTPHYFIAVGVGWLCGPSEGWLIATMALIPAYNHFQHRFYHMEESAREALAPWYLHWFFLSDEVQRISIEHQAHHHDRGRMDDYYNLLPFGHYILKPLFGRY